MIGLMAQNRWLFVAAVGVFIVALLTAWLLMQAEAFLVAPIGALTVLSFGGAVIGLARAAAARRALAADMAATLRALARVENRLSLAERRVARLAIRLGLTEDEER